MRPDFQILRGLLLVLAVIVSLNLSGQRNLLNKKIKLSSHDGTVEKILDEISLKGNFTFTYSSKIPVNKVVHLSSNKLTVKDYLFEIFKNDPVRYYAKNNKILLVPFMLSDNKGLQRITGRVIEKGTDEPLQFTNVFLLDKKIGTITNSEGDFCLNLKTFNGNDTLCISNMGYHLVKVPLNSLDSTFITFKLIPQTHEIKEVRIKPIDPIDLISEAIEKIPQNYSTKPYLMTAFFRESTKKDDEYISLSEALIKVYKESYNNSRKDQVKFEKGRNGNNVISMKYLDFIVQGGLYNNFTLDVIKYGINFLDKESFDSYNYKFDKISRYRGLPVYIVQFEQKEIDFPYYSGKIYIDKESYAIVKVEFGISSRGINFANDIYIVKNPDQYKVKPQYADYQVNYIKEGNKWALNSARSEIRIFVKSKKEKKKKKDYISSLFTSVSEFVITEKDSVNVQRFKNDEISKPNDILFKQIAETDETFWGEDNIILPDEPLIETIMKINQTSSIKEPEIPVAKKNQ